MIAPCKGCEKRHFKCHSECEDYKAFVDDLNDRREKRKQDSEFVCYLIDKKARKEREMKIKKRFRRKP